MTQTDTPEWGGIDAPGDDSAGVHAPGVRLSVMVLADVQDSLLAIVHDLHRLDGLLVHATENLMDRFSRVGNALSDAADPGDQASHARDELKQAVTELQFQDMASQLILHTTKVLRGCAFRLAAEAMEPEPDEIAIPFEAQAPDRPNPVSQSEMDAGSVELF